LWSIDPAAANDFNCIAGAMTLSGNCDPVKCALFSALMMPVNLSLKCNFFAFFEIRLRRITTKTQRLEEEY